MLHAFLISTLLSSLSGPSTEQPTSRKRAGKAAPSVRSTRGRTVSTAREAETIAERETGGEAVASHRIPLNGATGGWEVDVRMPRGDRGYRCIIDNDTRALHSKTLIPNPGRTGRRR